VPYVIAKSGIEGLVRSSAEELGRFQITTNALRLGYFDRGMAKRDVPNEILETISKSSASRSLGMPHNLSAALNYLLDKNSGFQTGSIIDLDGGLF
jgi:NAD(P)-dependent dehydrogenase (short-subunit alcohol dehydrogenase family)